MNPKQFNDAKDLELYPRTLEKDLELLYNIGVDAVYCPDTNDVFGPNYMDEPIDLGNIESIIEGAQRHGHFIGVARVVKRLFEIVQPDNAFFGQRFSTNCHNPQISSTVQFSNTIAYLPYCARAKRIGHEFQKRKTYTAYQKASRIYLSNPVHAKKRFKTHAYFCGQRKSHGYLK